jgi:ELWxxDGT repeat protein
MINHRRQPCLSAASVALAAGMLAVTVSTASAQSAKPFLLADINSGELTQAGSNPFGGYYDKSSAPLGAGLVFSASDRLHGQELWYTDGTTEGTRLVKDILPGSRGSSPEWMVSLGDVVLFGAKTDEIGAELWRTDGTESGTYVITDLYPGSGEGPGRGIVAGGKAYFSMYGKLYQTDGTAEGTIELIDLHSTISNIVAVGDRVYFTARVDEGPSDLWFTDGTAATTQSVSNAGKDIQGMFAVGDQLIFFPTATAIGTEPWVTDGTTAGTYLLKDVTPGFESTRIELTSYSAVGGGKLYFRANDGVHGVELWESDGTIDGTKLSADINPGSASSNPTWITGIDSGVLFFASAGGNRIYFRTTEELIVLPAMNDFSSAIGLGSRAYFQGGTGGQVWSTDGTINGTIQVATGTQYYPLQGAAFGPGKALLRLSDTVHGEEPWITDNTPAGTAMLRDISTGTGDSNPSVLTSIGDGVVFVATDGSSGRELWSVPSAGAPGMVLDLNPGPASAIIGDIDGFGDRAIFWPTTAGVGYEPWITDGTTAGTNLVLNVEPGNTNSWVNAGGNLPVMISGEGKFYYINAGASNPATFNELVASDGTAADTRVLTINSRPSTGGLLNGINGATLGETLLFAGEGANSGAELWRSDGTVAGTFMLKEFISGSTGGLTIREQTFISIGSKVLFAADDGQKGSELWVTDGTLGGTTLVKDIRFGSGSSSPQPICRVGDRAIFIAQGPTKQLWVSDGTPAGTLQISSFSPGLNSNALTYPAMGGGDNAFFVLNRSETGSELWVSNGTAAGTHIVKDIRPGAVSGIHGPLLAAAGGRCYFAADDGIHGLELWVSDGTADGTYMTGDIWPGLPSSSPTNAAIAGTMLYFNAYRPEEGNELWALNLCPADFDMSGFVDGDDFDAFVTAFELGDDAADFDRTGFVDTDDFTAFVHAFEAGC